MIQAIVVIHAAWGCSGCSAAMRTLTPVYQLLKALCGFRIPHSPAGDH